MPIAIKTLAGNVTGPTDGTALIKVAFASALGTVPLVTASAVILSGPNAGHAARVDIQQCAKTGFSLKISEWDGTLWVDSSPGTQVQASWMAVG